MGVSQRHFFLALVLKNLKKREVNYLAARNRFGENVRQQRIFDRKNQEPFMPKGFDIKLSDVISSINPTEEELKNLGLATKAADLASLDTGRETFYRKRQIEAFFGREIDGQ